MLIPRRGFILGSIAAMAFGQASQQGFQEPGLVVASEVEIIGPRGELLVYNPSVGLGNLIASISAVGGSDGAGNTLYQGFVSYVSGIVAQLFAGELAFFDPTFPPMNNARVGLGAVGPHTQSLILSSGNVSTDTAANVDMASNASGLPVFNTNAEIQAPEYVATIGGAPESWHTISSGFPAGWSGTVAYRQLAEDGSIFMIDLNLTIANGTVVTNPETITTGIPAHYLPFSRPLPMLISGAGAPGTFLPCFLSAAGGLTFNGGAGFTAGAGGAFIGGSAVYQTAV